MVRTRGLSYLVGALTAWMPLYLVVFVAFGVTMALTDRPTSSSSGPPPVFLVFLGLHLLTMLLTVALLAVYLVDVFRNPDLAHTQDKRIMWVVLVVVLNSFAMLVYWWIFLRPGGDAFARRQQVASPAPG